MKLSCGNRTLDLGSAHVMGILNVTPDSFSDGGQYNQLDKALARAESMVAEGATILDIGGESTRPGAAAVTVAEELERVVPVVEGIAARLDVAISVDTSTAEVISQAASAGAHLINDVRALRRDGALQAAADSQLPVCLMHMQGEPDTMQKNPRYDDVVQDVRNFLKERIAAAHAVGIASEKILLDPGFGFGKTRVHNYTLLNRLEQIAALGYPLLTGLSRKRMIADVLNSTGDATERDDASAAAATLCAMKGARIIRAHNVKKTWEALQVVNATLREGHE
ncbi:MAG: dihydropteroate synthase [Thalassolituus sp.]|uniref:dihydropteroate synthase n=1 Tax=unclassified Thalassolituus TaxID=2624967 RepID=UPI0023B3FE8E|nr:MULTISPECIES: dihydropteroate synthase [unclassified Thalassolituus]MDQ4423311.1 dihydropteroate synthase [Thalassolituus sp.]MDQ4426230.1 dihydropteroate synthase [Thalassolituus sp.]